MVPAVEAASNYYRHTELHKEPGGLRRLDLICAALDRQRRGRPRQALRILDVGCGNGNVGIPLASLGYEVVGIDADSASVEVAQERNPFDNATFLVRDASALEIDGPFDAIVCAEILEHLAEPLRLLDSLSALLNEDGALLVTIPNGYSIEEILRRFLTRTEVGLSLRSAIRRWLLREKTVQTQNVGSPHLQYFTLGSFRNLIDKADMRITREDSWTTFFMPLYYVLLRLFVKRGSGLFRRLDRWDATLAEGLPATAAGGWFFVIRRESEDLDSEGSPGVRSEVDG